MRQRFGERPLRLEIIRRNDHLKAFKILPRRWVLERTFGWLHNFRRLSKDYEFLTSSSEAFILIASSKILISRLAMLARLLDFRYTLEAFYFSASFFRENTITHCKIVGTGRL